MHPILVGTIAVGLLEIPVKVYSAKDEREPYSIQLCAECRSPIQLRRWCPKCASERDQSQIVKGVRRGPGHVVLPGAPEEVRARPDRRIPISSFVSLAEVDLMYVEKSYFLEPAGPEVRAFKLLKRALEVSGQGALGRATLRSREVPVLLRNWGRTIAMHSLTRPDEIRKATAFKTGKGRVSAKELGLALQLIRSATSPFLSALVRESQGPGEGTKPAGAAAPKSAGSAETADGLLALLEQSLKELAH